MASFYTENRSESSAANRDAQARQSLLLPSPKLPSDNFARFPNHQYEQNKQPSTDPGYNPEGSRMNRVQPLLRKTQRNRPQMHLDPLTAVLCAQSRKHNRTVRRAFG
jgi:hypothetical protein